MAAGIDGGIVSRAAASTRRFSNLVFRERDVLFVSSKGRDRHHKSHCNECLICKFLQPKILKDFSLKCLYPQLVYRFFLSKL